jgi:ADP-heptose:LPS heptosyltransferase
LANPYIDQLITIENEIDEIKAKLLAENYDFVIDLHHNLRTFRLKRFLKVKSASFPKLNIEKWLLVNLKINRLPKKHVVDRYFEATNFLSIQNDGLGLDYFISKKDEQGATKHYPEIHTRYACLALGAQFATNACPLSNWRN